MYSFQYRLISCYVLLLISLAVYAQSGKESFAGRVVDTETYQPVSFATIRLLSLPDSTLLVGGATDINGKFQLSFIRKTPISLCFFMFPSLDISLFISLYSILKRLFLPIWEIYP